jgi:hypothetical protein
LAAGGCLKFAMRFAAAFFLAAASLAGCTPMQWVKPDAAADEVRGDEQACRVAAAREASYHNYWSQHRMQPVIAGPGQMIWPSGAFVDPYAQQFLDENRLAHFCMESKGYQLKEVTIHPSPGGAVSGKP